MDANRFAKLALLAAIVIMCLSLAAGLARGQARGHDWLLENPDTEPRRLIPSDPCGRGVDAMAREITRLQREVDRLRSK